MPAKKFSQNSTSKVSAREPKHNKSVTGRASVEQGRKFEEDVAELYRLQGADIVQNVMLGRKKVDILATFSYPARHRVIIECKDEKRAVDALHRVMEFHGLLTTLRQTGVAESAEIITRVPWGDAAKGYALESGITVLTYTEKISQLIHFTPYLRELISRYDNGELGRINEPPLSKYYITLSAELNNQGVNEEIPVIDTFLHDWLQKEGQQKQLAIFGDYGAGKSSLCLKFAHDLAVKYLNDHSSNRIPILLNLRDFIGKIDMEAFITSFLDRECKVANPKADLFRAMSHAGIFLIIFDGFDEMAVKVDADTLEANLSEIDKLASVPNSKVLLTSRPEYFKSQIEETQALTPSVRLLSNRAAEYEPIRILPWDDQRVKLFLKRRVPLVKETTEPWTYYWDRINNIGSLSDLSRRPVLLEMIVRTLPRLIASKAPISLTNLYHEYLSGEIERQTIRKGRTLLLTKDRRLSLLRQIAADLHTKSISAITFGEVRKRIESLVNPSPEEAEARTREFLTNSFLIRRIDEYYFSHKSIQEYLVAAQLTEDIRKGDSKAFKRVLNQPVINDFIIELGPDKERLWNWIHETKGRSSSTATFLGGNAASLLNALSHKEFSGTDLSQTLLMNANLTSAELRETNLWDTNLANADLSFADLRGAYLKRTDMTGVILRGSKFTWKDLAPTLFSKVYITLHLAGENLGNRFDQNFNQMLGSAFAKYLRTEIYELRSAEIFNNMAEPYVEFEMFLNIDLRDYNVTKAKIEQELGVTLAVYADEIEQLHKYK